MSERTKGPGEVFCTACGAAIKAEAEICPACGVRNEAFVPAPTPERASAPHDPDAYETTVSASWWRGTAAGAGAWVLIAALSGLSDGAFATIYSLVTVFAWIGLPLTVYYDAQYVRANSKWNPSTPLWGLLLAVPFVNILVALVYLYRRHEVLGVP